jgi:branched-chain amino acid transport system substrate-binding protein
VSGGSRVKQVKRVGATIALALLAAFAAFAGLEGCSADGLPGDRIHGRTLTIYSSAPLDGPSSIAAQAIVSGERLALARVHGRIGEYRIVLQVLDDATAQRGGWDPGQTTDNARRAIADRTTIGYLGELDSGASAISIPVLNRAGIAQISPASTAVGLTVARPGASPGEPQKYYPTGVRTYARVVPNDSVQAIAQVRLQLSEGCNKTFVLDDGEVDGSDTAASFQLAAQAAGLPVAGVHAFDPRATSYSSLIAGVAQTGADCVLISAATESHAAMMTEQIGSALPNAMIFGSAGMGETTYTDPAEGGIPTSLDRRVLITAPGPGPERYAAADRAFFASYRQRFGAPQPYAISGYEAMSLMLDAIARATRNGRRTALRSKLVRAIFATRDRHSVLGTYSIDHDGDTTLRRYGVYRVIHGHLVFWKAIDV